jgi:hypothetical protein
MVLVAPRAGNEFNQVYIQYRSPRPDRPICYSIEEYISQHVGSYQHAKILGISGNEPWLYGPLTETENEAIRTQIRTSKKLSSNVR